MIKTDSKVAAATEHMAAIAVAATAECVVVFPSFYSVAVTTVKIAVGQLQLSKPQDFGPAIAMRIAASRTADAAMVADCSAGYSTVVAVMAALVEVMRADTLVAAAQMADLSITVVAPMEDSLADVVPTVGILMVSVTDAAEAVSSDESFQDSEATTVAAVSRDVLDIPAADAVAVVSSTEDLLADVDMA